MPADHALLRAVADAMVEATSAEHLLTAMRAKGVSVSWAPEQETFMDDWAEVEAAAEEFAATAGRVAGLAGTILEDMKAGNDRIEVGNARLEAAFAQFEATSAILGKARDNAR